MDIKNFKRIKIPDKPGVYFFKKGESIEAVDLFEPPPPSAAIRPFKNVDGIKFLNHQGGCGGIRQDAAVLSKLLAAYADHPNVGGVTVLSLGCQNLQTSNFLQDLKQRTNNNNRSTNTINFWHDGFVEKRRESAFFLAHFSKVLS